MRHLLIINSRGKVEEDSFYAIVKAFSEHKLYTLSGFKRNKSLITPLVRKTSYSDIAKKTFITESLPEGNINYYDKPILPEAGFYHDKIKISSRGKIEKEGKIPTINIGDFKTRRFPLIERAQKAKIEIMAQEDEAIFQALDSIASVKDD